MTTTLSDVPTNFMTYAAVAILRSRGYLYTNLAASKYFNCLGEELTDYYLIVRSDGHEIYFPFASSNNSAYLRPDPFGEGRIFRFPNEDIVLPWKQNDIFRLLREVRKIFEDNTIVVPFTSPGVPNLKIVEIHGGKVRWLNRKFYESGYKAGQPESGRGEISITPAQILALIEKTRNSFWVAYEAGFWAKVADAHGLKWGPRNELIGRRVRWVKNGETFTGTIVRQNEVSGQAISVLLDEGQYTMALFPFHDEPDGLYPIHELATPQGPGYELI